MDILSSEGKLFVLQKGVLQRGVTIGCYKGVLQRGVTKEQSIYMERLYS